MGAKEERRAWFGGLPHIRPSATFSRKGRRALSGEERASDHRSPKTDHRFLDAIWNLTRMKNVEERQRALFLFEGS